MLSQALYFQGLDALGAATLSSATSAAASRLPFAVPSPSPSLDNEDATNLRNLHRLLLLLSKVPQKEDSSPVSKIFNKRSLLNFSHFLIIVGVGEMHKMP
jgi:hypothetical protein